MLKSDVAFLMSALPRIQFACEPRDEGGVRPRHTSGGLTEHQARILRHLDLDDPTMVSELAEYMGVTNSTMSLTLRRLEAAGYIHRTRDPDDRRVMNVRLTPEGGELKDAAQALDPDRLDALLRRLSDEDRIRALQGVLALSRAADALLGRVQSPSSNSGNSPGTL